MNNKQKTCALGLAFGLVASTQSFASEQLPVHKFNITCAPSLNNYVSELRDIVQFSRKYETQPVYVSIQVEATARSGFCSMLRNGPGVDASKQPEDHGIRSPYIEAPPNTLVVWARTLSHTAGTTTLSLPSLTELPADGLYEARTGGKNFYYYSGPAVLRHSTANGNEHVDFQPINQSHKYWKEIVAARKTMNAVYGQD